MVKVGHAGIANPGFVPHQFLHRPDVKGIYQTDAVDEVM